MEGIEEIFRKEAEEKKKQIEAEQELPTQKKWKRRQTSHQMVNLIQRNPRFNFNRYSLNSSGITGNDK